MARTETRCESCGHKLRPEKPAPVGTRFNRLVVLGFAPKRGSDIRWMCKCDCGTVKDLSSKHVKRSRTKSCGCLVKETSSKAMSEASYRHGHYGSPTYMSWSSMMARCRQSNRDPSKAIYRNKNITVCERWKDFKSFLEDMGMRPEGTTIDRIDNSKGYSPENCRWATATEQCRNKTTNVLFELNGKLKTVPEWAEILCVNKHTLISRVRKNPNHLAETYGEK